MITLSTDLTDGQLLDRYVQDGNSGAFRDLVHRHGPAVQRICLGVLKDLHEAEDAFQATFLVLARRAAEIRDPEALRGWLRGVAQRVATRARQRSCRRRQFERPEGGIHGREPASRSREPDVELRELIGEELKRLPDDYRRPIVLCYLDGLTHEQAARRLDWPVGTVKVRLVRGRRLLRERLDRRGVALGAALLSVLGTGRRARAVTGALVESTARAIRLDAAGRLVALDREYPRVLELADALDGPVRLFRYPGLWAAALVAALVLGLSGPASRALSGPSVSDFDPAKVPGNLADVLNVECR